MKIAYIVEPRKIIGGGVRAAMNLSKGMASFYNVNTAIFGIFVNTVKDPDILFYPVNTLKPISLSYMRAYHKFIKSYNPEIVHCLGLFTALLCVVYRKLTRRNYSIVCTVHRVTMNMRYFSLIKYVIGFIERNIDYATFLTEYQKKHYFSKIGFRPDKFAVVPNVIFVKNIEQDEKNKMRKMLTKELGVDFITSYVGRIIPSKNIEDTIKIIALAQKRGFNLGCVFVGGYGEDYYNKLQKLTEELGIVDKIKFVGFVNNPSLYTASSDFTTTTTLGEALPNLLVESYALGKVTFSSDIPQMVDLIETGINGFTLSLNKLTTFVDKMYEFCSNTELRNKIENAAYNTYKKQYSPEYVLSVYAKIYSSI